MGFHPTICFIRFYNTNKGHTSFSPPHKQKHKNTTPPNLPIHFPGCPLKPPSDSLSAPWPHGWFVNQRVISTPGFFWPPKKKTREPIHSTWTHGSTGSAAWLMVFHDREMELMTKLFSWSCVPFGPDSTKVLFLKKKTSENFNTEGWGNEPVQIYLESRQFMKLCESSIIYQPFRFAQEEEWFCISTYLLELISQHKYHLITYRSLDQKSDHLSPLNFPFPLPHLCLTLIELGGSAWVTCPANKRTTETDSWLVPTGFSGNSFERNLTNLYFGWFNLQHCNRVFEISPG